MVPPMVTDVAWPGLRKAIPMKVAISPLPLPLGIGTRSPMSARDTGQGRGSEDAGESAEGGEVAEARAETRRAVATANSA